jgi:hypothetical protein
LIAHHQSLIGLAAAALLPETEISGFVLAEIPF